MASISTLATKCANLFANWLELESSNANASEAVENRLFRFNLWAANNSALSSGRDSMDKRLRKSSVPHSVIVDLLEALSAEIIRRLAQAPVIEDTSDDSPDTILDRLFRFSRAIRRSGVLRRYAKVADFFEYDEKGHNLTVKFRTAVQEYLDLQFKNTDRKLRHRLVETIYIRQQNFAYLVSQRMNRKAKMREDTEFSESRNEIVSVKPQLSMSYSVRTGRTKKIQPAAVQSQPPIVVARKPLASATTLSKNATPVLDVPQKRSGLQIPLSDLPRRPKSFLGNKELECPYCLIVCPASEFEESEWAYHIEQDLMPYVCVIEDCQTPNTMYDSKAAWLSHMQKEHFRNGWVCMDRSHESPAQFQEVSYFKQHIQEHIQQNGEKITDEELHQIVDECYGPLSYDNPLETCPFCSVYNITEKQEQKAEDHVAEHLLHLSQISLAWHYDSNKAFDFEPDMGNVSSNRLGESSIIEHRLEGLREENHSASTGNQYASPNRTGQDYIDDSDEDRAQRDSEDVGDEIKDPEIPAGALDTFDPWSQYGLSQFLETQNESLHPNPASDSILQNLLRYQVKPIFDEDFAWTTLDSDMVQSKFDTTKQFMPDGAIDRVVSRKFVLAAMHIQYPTDGDSLMIDYILGRAKKLFCISAYIGLEQTELRHAMTLFFEATIDDSFLPFGYNQAQSSGLGPAETDITYETNAAYSFLASIEHDQASKVWRRRVARDFFEYQWRFLAPIFSTDEPARNFSALTILPFVERQPNYEMGAFGRVFKYKLHPDHFKDLSRPNDTSPDFVAIKEIWMQDKKDHRAMARQWAEEARILTIMNSLSQDHIVRFMSSFRRNHGDDGEYYLMFEWADGNNLRTLWSTFPHPERKASFVKATIEQLLGLAEALRACHYYDDKGSSYRHGDLKPENILWFRDGNNELGTLKIGDWGSARGHNLITEDRASMTKTRFGTLRYEAPETAIGLKGKYIGQAKDRRSRLGDIWALGCIILEFIVWLRYGHEGLQRFNESVNGPSEGRTPFYEISEQHSQYNTATVHRAVVSWMDNLSSDPACRVGTSALGDLLELVRTGLLVVRLPRNLGSNILADNDSPQPYQKPDGTSPSIMISIEEAQERHPVKSLPYNGPSRLRSDQVVERLKLIVNDDDGADYWNSISSHRVPPVKDDSSVRDSLMAQTKTIIPVNSRSPVVPVNDRIDYSSPQRGNDWEHILDNGFALNFFKVIADNIQNRGPSLRRGTQLCTKCLEFQKIIWTPQLDIEYDVEWLKARSISRECDLCGLFLNTYERYCSTNVNTIILRLVDSTLRINDISRAVLSVFQSSNSRMTRNNDIQIGFEELPTNGSYSHLELVRQWLSNCQDNHTSSSCQTAGAKERAPTRLIDVGQTGDDYVRLRETSGAHAGEWIALSYQWGSGGPPFYTSRENLDSRLQRMVLVDFPATYYDAVVVTRRLGYRYLWIDALCIVCDDSVDWRVEADHMESIFSGAVCVIAASCASSFHSGFLNPLKDRRHVTLQGSDTEELTFHVCEMIDDFNEHVLHGALNQRGWVLQEHALARRTIFFTDYQTYFECGDGVRCETMTKMRNGLAAFLGDPNFPQKMLDAPASERIIRLQYFYSMYSRRALTYAGDRPIAIGGLQKRIMRAMNAQGDYGILDDGKTNGLLHRSLLWHRGDNTRRLSRFKGRVPSWSWMAYTEDNASGSGGVDYFRVPFGDIHWEEVLSPWSNNSSNVEFQEISVAIAANVRQFTHLDYIDEEGREDGMLVFDDPGGSMGTGRRENLCVVLGVQKGSMLQNEKRHYLLILAPIGHQDGHKVYERVGAGWLPGRCLAEDSTWCKVY